LDEKTIYNHIICPWIVASKEPRVHTFGFGARVMQTNTSLKTTTPLWGIFNVWWDNVFILLSHNTVIYCYSITFAIVVVLMVCMLIRCCYDLWFWCASYWPTFSVVIAFMSCVLTIIIDPVLCIVTVHSRWSDYVTHTRMLYIWHHIWWAGARGTGFRQIRLPRRWRTLSLSVNG
jgi:hypothetical protein